MNTADAALETLRGEVVDIVLGTIFLSIGATACAIAAIRWRRGVRTLVWLGVFSGMFGLQKLVQTPTVLAVLPHALKSATPYVSTAVMYLLLVSALFAWREHKSAPFHILHFGVRSLHTMRSRSSHFSTRH